MFAWKYDRVRDKIIACMDPSGNEESFNDLRRSVKAAFTQEDRELIGRPVWAFEAVVLEMEVRGEIIRTGPSERLFPQRLRLTLAP